VTVAALPVPQVPPNAFAWAVIAMAGLPFAASASDGPTYIPHDAEAQPAGTVGVKPPFNVEVPTLAVSCHVPAAPVQSPEQRASDDAVPPRMAIVGCAPLSRTNPNPTSPAPGGIPSSSGGFQLAGARQFDSQTS